MEAAVVSTENQIVRSSLHLMELMCKVYVKQ